MCLFKYEQSDLSQDNIVDDRSHGSISDQYGARPDQQMKDTHTNNGNMINVMSWRYMILNDMKYYCTHDFSTP